MLSERQVMSVFGDAARRVDFERLAAVSMPIVAMLAVAVSTLHGHDSQASPAGSTAETIGHFDVAGFDAALGLGAFRTERALFGTEFPLFGTETERALFGPEGFAFGRDQGIEAGRVASEVSPEAADEVGRLASRTGASGEAVRRGPAPRVSAAERLRAEPAMQVALAEPAPTAIGTSAEQRKVAHFIAKKYRLALDDVQHFVGHAYQAAREFRLDPYLVLAVVSIESSFNPNARSSKGAQGLMQVLTRVHLDKFKPFGGASAAFDPVANLAVGSRILKDYLVREGSIEGALKSYVGAALLPHDYGYGRKVLSERERIAAAAARPGTPGAPTLRASASTEAERPSPAAAEPRAAASASAEEPARPLPSARVPAPAPFPSVSSAASKAPASLPLASKGTAETPFPLLAAVRAGQSLPWLSPPQAEEFPSLASGDALTALTDAPFEPPAVHGGDLHGPDAVDRLLSSLSQP